MRIGVFGAGGVGGLLAGLLARAGHDVALIARGAARDRILERGLHIDSPLGSFDAKVEVADAPAKLAPVSAVLLAVKAWQVPVAAAAVAPWLAADGVVVPLQNGVDAPDECASAVGAARVVGGLCYVLSQLVEPGSVKHLGEPPRITLSREVPVAEALRSAGARVDVSSDFQRALWEKFLFIASFGGVGALTRSTAGAIRTIPETRALLISACEEVRAVAAARGITLDADVVARTVAFVDALPEQATPSLERDIVSGRPSELQALSGAVVRIAGELGVKAPVHSTIYGALLPLERVAEPARR